MRSRLETNEGVLNAAFNRNQREHDPRFRDPERALSLSLSLSKAMGRARIERWPGEKEGRRRHLVTPRRCMATKEKPRAEWNGTECQRRVNYIPDTS